VPEAGTVFTVGRTADKVDHVWWRRDGVLSWVSSTLSYRFEKEEPLAVAESMTLIANHQFLGTPSLTTRSDRATSGWDGVAPEDEPRPG
jgi:hypothetical protein